MPRAAPPVTKADSAKYKLSLRARKPLEETPTVPVAPALAAVPKIKWVVKSNHVAPALPAVPKIKWVVKSKHLATAGAPARAELVFDAFTRFAQLPSELQLMVWREAIAGNGRILTLKKSPVPAVFHACSDSRREAIKAGYQICNQDCQSGYVIQPGLDILFLDRTAFPASTNYHVNAFHTLRCNHINKSMLEPVQRLALSVKEVLSIWNTICFHCFLLKNLDGFFPNLKELVIILRPGALGSGYDDLYEVQESSSAYLDTIIDDIKERYRDALEDHKALGKIQLKFMRIEKFVN
ncbi:hypothetical protein BUE80_DR001811 [Diplocarpon rosae]|nr:hypothetical protein BUE80_DR001811 [Diplocarpon rosae]